MAEAPSAPYTSQHTLFEAAYASERGLRLQDQACLDHRPALMNPVDYRATQALGRQMRDAGVEAFEYPSARCPALGTNVGLFHPTALADQRPLAEQAWLCRTDGRQVAFTARGLGRALCFGLEQFSVDGSLPQAAT